MGARGEAHVGLQDYARLQRGPAGVGGALQTESKRTVHRLLQAAVGPRHHAADSGNSPSTTAPGARTVFAQNTNLDKAAGCNAKFSRVALPPGTPLTLHVAAVSSEFFVAAKGCESSRRTVALVGATLTLTCVAGGSGVGGGGEGGRKDSPSPAHPSAQACREGEKKRHHRRGLRAVRLSGLRRMAHALLSASEQPAKIPSTLAAA